MSHTVTDTAAPAAGLRFWTVWALILLACNATLFGAPGPSPARWILDPAALRAGEWWRWFTHPLIHTSLYHLLLDGLGVLGVEALAGDRRPLRRALLWIAALSGSALAALLAAPTVHRVGLCGLSGLGHGLLAHHLLTQAGATHDRAMRRAHSLAFALIVAKCGWEGVTGRVLFENWHPGPLGQPIGVCHAGGALAGCLVALAFRPRPSKPPARATSRATGRVRPRNARP